MNSLLFWLLIGVGLGALAAWRVAAARRAAKTPPADAADTVPVAAAGSEACAPDGAAASAPIPAPTSASYRPSERYLPKRLAEEAARRQQALLNGHETERAGERRRLARHGAPATPVAKA
ncbi:MAG: hypothetical protein ABW032_04375, partial [Burkholderiaceae bacterium]